MALMNSDPPQAMPDQMGTNGEASPSVVTPANEAVAEPKADTLPMGRWARLWRHLNTTGEDYRITRWVLVRFMGFVYFVAFLIAAQQIVPLVGRDGLLPVDLYLPRVERYLDRRADREWTYDSEKVSQLLKGPRAVVDGAGDLIDSTLGRHWRMPSIFWRDHSDEFIQAAMWAGVGISFLVMCGYANAIMMFALFVLYLSLDLIGQDWCSYGWDSQILETGFLVMMLCPLLDPRPFSARAPPMIFIWLLRWLIFKIMLGAGLIKIRGDELWRDLTALYYHYETQPVPNPLSRYLHFAPHWFQKFGVLVNHFVELVVPPFAFAKRALRHIAGLLMAGFMVVLIFSGNLSFLNWLTIVPCLACFDDSFWRRVLPRFITLHAEGVPAVCPAWRRVVPFGIAAVLIMINLLGPVPNFFAVQQQMNTSYDRFHLVGSYGAFGSVGIERHEIIFEGTSDPVPDELSDWKPYEFKVKPGDIQRRPAIITPYHYRLDWQMWFAAMATPNEYPWTIHLAWKLLQNDPGTLSLIANNPFPADPPRFIRAVLYRYRYAPLGNEEGNWWTRERLGLWIRPLAKDDRNLRSTLQSAGWLRE